MISVRLPVDAAGGSPLTEPSVPTRDPDSPWDKLELFWIEVAAGENQWKRGLLCDKSLQGTDKVIALAGSVGADGHPRWWTNRMRMRFRAKFEQVSQRPPIISTKDPSTGELRGVAVDLSRELAARIGVELVQVPYPRPQCVGHGLSWHRPGAMRREN